MPKHNGADVLVAVNVTDSAVPDFVVVGGQRGADFGDTTALIDVSDKESGRLGASLPGRATAELSIDMVYESGDEALAFLQAAYRNRQQVTVMRQFRPDGEGGVYSNVESALATIIDFSESWPDQEAATISFTVHMDEDWVAAA